MSLIGCHTLAGTGIEYPKKKPTWRYIKGDEKDFMGAPDWASVKMEFEGQTIFEEHLKPVIGVSRYSVVGDSEIGEWDIATTQGGEIIAQRERVTSVNDDRPAHELRPHSIHHSDGTVQFGYIPADVNALIAERGSRYGKFADGAEIIRDLKHVMHEVDGWNNLTASQKEALDMIQHKIGRILNGDPTYDDNWKDIAGYATLIVEELNGNTK